MAQCPAVLGPRQPASGGMGAGHPKPRGGWPWVAGGLGDLSCGLRALSDVGAGRLEPQVAGLCRCGGRPTRLTRAPVGQPQAAQWPTVSSPGWLVSGGVGASCPEPGGPASGDAGAGCPVAWGAGLGGSGAGGHGADGASLGQHGSWPSRVPGDWPQVAQWPAVPWPAWLATGGSGAGGPGAQGAGPGGCGVRPAMVGAGAGLPESWGASLRHCGCRLSNGLGGPASGGTGAGHPGAWGSGSGWHGCQPS